MNINFFLEKIKTQAFQSSVFKAMTGLLMFLSISILVKLFGKSDYGVWVLIYSFFQWGLYFDFGISNVLKTKIPELIHKNEVGQINNYINESIRITIIIALVVLLVFTVFIYNVEITQLFNIKIEEVKAKNLFILNGVFFAFNFVFSINKSLFIGVLKPKISELSATINQFVFFILVLFLLLLDKTSYSFDNKLLITSWVNGLSTIMINLFFLLYFFKNNSFKTSLTSKLNSIIIIDLFKNGFPFLLIQFFMIIIFFSDPYFISSYCTTEDVGIYDILNKLFQLPLLVAISGISSFWPFFSIKYHEKDFNWFVIKFRKFDNLFVFITIGLLLFSFLSKWILKLWLGLEFYKSVEIITLVLLSLTIITRIYFTFYANFFNGINKLKSQLYLMSATAIIKIPITIYILKNGWGINGLFLQLTIFMLLWSLILKLQAKAIINNLSNE